MEKIRRMWDGFLIRLKERHFRFPIHGKKQWAVFLLGMLLAIGGLIVILRVENDYYVLKNFEKQDVSGTEYVHFGHKLLKYSPDGVSCLNQNGEVIWNTTFSMQSPIADICGTTAVIGDQQGMGVYIFDEDGLIGQFQTLLPIAKVKVAKQGVVAAVLEDEDVTWINFYDTEGEEIAKFRTTLKESGYPLDVALSPDGMKIMVSFLYMDEGILKTNISFYNFDSIGQAEENNLVNEVSYNNVVAPSVFFVDSERAVAIRSDGFTIYRGKDVPQTKHEVSITEEILTTFCEDDCLGFILKSDKTEYQYKMLVYNMNGNCIMKKYFNMDYDRAKMENGNIILYNAKGFQVYSSRGRLKADITYKKAVEDVICISGIGKYLVVCSESTEMIRVK